MKAVFLCCVLFIATASRAASPAPAVDTVLKYPVGYCC